MTSRQGAAEVCTSVVEGVPRARADPNERKFSSPRDMNPPTVKNARERKSSVKVRHSNGTWRSERPRSKKCSCTVTATSLDTLVRSRVPFGPWMR